MTSVRLTVAGKSISVEQKSIWTAALKGTVSVCAGTLTAAFVSRAFIDICKADRDKAAHDIILITVVFHRVYSSDHLHNAQLKSLMSTCTYTQLGTFILNNMWECMLILTCARTYSCTVSLGKYSLRRVWLTSAGSAITRQDETIRTVASERALSIAANLLTTSVVSGTLVYI